MTRRQAFGRIRRVIGPEVCPLVADMLDNGATDASKLFTVRTTAHQLRHALAAAVVLLTSDPVRCPNCEHSLPHHNAKCVIHRLTR